MVALGTLTHPCPLTWEEPGRRKKYFGVLLKDRERDGAYD